MTLRYTTLHQTTLHYTTIHYATLHYTTPHHTTLQLQLHYTTTYNCATPHYIQQLRVRRPPQPLEPLQWIRFAIHASQQLTSPIVSYHCNFRHRLVRYYWYIRYYALLHKYLGRVYCKLLPVCSAATKLNGTRIGLLVVAMKLAASLEGTHGPFCGASSSAGVFMPLDSSCFSHTNYVFRSSFQTRFLLQENAI